MYNRYIPQNDGTYCRKSVQEQPKQAREPSKPSQTEQSSPPPPVPVPLPCQSCVHQPQSRRVPPPRQYKTESAQGISGFLKQLLPKDFGTEDLLVVLLLLLMANDCSEDQNSALLTLALYLFL